MGINLQKGQKIDLTKGGAGGAGMSRVLVGLGWDEAQIGGGGLFGSRNQHDEIDCDASVILLGANGKLYGNPENSDDYLVFFNNLRHYSGAIQHMGDNLTGGSMGGGQTDSEQITVDLNRVPPDVFKLVFVVNIYDGTAKGQHFGMIRNAYIRLSDMTTRNEICRFNLSENYYGMTGMVVGEIYRYNGNWKFNAIGQPIKEASRLISLVKLYI